METRAAADRLDRGLLSSAPPPGKATRYGDRFALRRKGRGQNEGCVMKEARMQPNMKDPKAIRDAKDKDKDKKKGPPKPGKPSPSGTKR
jgi:hypothetical protein